MKMMYKVYLCNVCKGSEEILYLTGIKQLTPSILYSVYNNFFPATI